MTRHVIAFAAAAALGIATLGGVSQGADETNRIPGQSSNVSGGSGTMGQTGATNSDHSGASSNSDRSSSSDSGATGSSSVSGQSGTSGSSGASAGISGQSGASGTSGTSGAGASGSVGPIGGEFALQGSEQDLRPALQSASDPDKLFLVCAAIDNQCEMQMAQLAQQKAQDPQVKQFAQRMMQDHQQAQQQLQTAAQESGVQLPRSIPAIKQQEMKVFQSLNGKEFDQHFISKMRAAHAKAVSEYQDVAQLAKEDHIKQYASKTLPTLQEHYQQVQQTATALGLPNTSEAQPAGARLGGESSGSSSGMKSSGSSGR